MYCSRRIKKGLCYGDTCSCKFFNLASCNFSAEMIQNLRFVVLRKNIETSVILMYTRERNGQAKRLCKKYQLFFKGDKLIQVK